MGGVAETAGGLLEGAKNLGGSITKPIVGNGGLLGREGDAPQMANIQQGTTVQNVQDAQAGTADALAAQRRLLEALQGQNGLGMQSQAASSQQALANQLAAANGVGAQTSALGGLQNAASMYQNIAEGRGPNPAQAMLNQATAQNVANQAALMAGQRGASANVGMLARQAAQQGANTQQQAAGQAATLQANQQLNALAGLTGANQAAAGVGSNLTGQQANANQAYANQANQIAGQQIAANQAGVQNALSNQQSMQNALQGVNNANVGAQSSVNTGNVDLSKANSAAKQGILGGVMQGAGTLMAAKGGMVHMAEGGAPEEQQPQSGGPMSTFGKFLQGATGGNNTQASNQFLVAPNVQQGSGAASMQKGTAALIGALKPKKQAGTGGGEMMAGEDTTSMQAPTMVASKGGLANKGGHVDAKKPSQKAVKHGNSYANDKIPAMLSEGEIVLPRSVTQAADPKAAAAGFVAQVLAKRKVKK